MKVSTVLFFSRAILLYLIVHKYIFHLFLSDSELEWLSLNADMSVVVELDRLSRLLYVVVERDQSQGHHSS